MLAALQAPQLAAPAATACLGQPCAALQPPTSSTAVRAVRACRDGSRGAPASAATATVAARLPSGVRFGRQHELHSCAPPRPALAAAAAVSGRDAAAVPRRRGRRGVILPDVDAEQLLHSLGLDGTADPVELQKRLHKLSGMRQLGMLDNAAAVAAHLLSPAVGLTQQQAGQLLERCPYLFSWRPGQRAAVLFGQLLGAGVTAAATAQCFCFFPPAAQCTSFAPGLAELAAILAHSQDREGGRASKVVVPAAQRSVAALLTQAPSALALVCNSAGYLQRRAAELQQAGYTPADVAALAWERHELLCTDAAAKLASRAAMLQQELGLPAEEVVSLAAKRKPAWLNSRLDTLQERAAALAEGFGQPAAADMLRKSFAVLNCGRDVWRRNLCYMAACGVADPKAVLQRAPALLPANHAAPEFLQRLLLLRRCFQLTAGQLYEQQTHRLMYLGPAELAQRLQFVEQRGQAHRLVAKAARGAKRATASSEEQRPALSLRAVTGRLDVFLLAAGASQAEWDAWAAANPPAACPLYGWAQQAAEEEAARLAAVLPPELAQAERRAHPQYWRSSAAQ